MKNLKNVLVVVTLFFFLIVNSVVLAQGKPEKAKKQEQKEKAENQKGIALLLLFSILKLSHHQRSDIFVYLTARLKMELFAKYIR